MLTLKQARIAYRQVAPTVARVGSHRRRARYWKWAIDTVIPMRAFETSGPGKDRADYTQRFKAA
jgi:hypothetical protein